jgi:hypothetical protein
VTDIYIYEMALSDMMCASRLRGSTGANPVLLRGLRG